MDKVDNWNRLARATGYNARELAKACSLSVRQLQRNFQNQFSLSPQRWLNERRLEDARSLLLTGIPVKVVALDLGYK